MTLLAIEAGQVIHQLEAAGVSAAADLVIAWAHEGLTGDEARARADMVIRGGEISPKDELDRAGGQEPADFVYRGPELVPEGVGVCVRCRGYGGAAQRCRDCDGSGVVGEPVWQWFELWRRPIPHPVGEPGEASSGVWVATAPDAAGRVCTYELRITTRRDGHTMARVEPRVICHTWDGIWTIGPARFATGPTDRRAAEAAARTWLATHGAPAWPSAEGGAS